MATYVALLRGVNVGGKNMIKMARLKEMFEAMGLNQVKTYIQSGNVLFQSNEEESQLRQRIEHEIEAVFGFPVIVTLRTVEQLERIIENCPFSDEEVAEAESSAVGESLYVALLTEEPVKEATRRLEVYANDNEKYRISGREVYLLFANSVRNSKLTSNLHKLNVPATVRNWNTINKLVVMAREIGV
ncbi:uncharacterized protein (DUF1697 family) [Paenibacillus anaericanus]|uniref:DUF1697 domain-containing protein n=1 Tax=Paenibacillus anaericanus TaxID=170367 RepID=UPI00278636A4|nr:DUF1697 domain-containing protein [Paenibacillus anaericanus]MDQ0086861.1 uncharacterized protein (DUF1697 family) [Paenibacillus anaericanus]